MYTYSLHNEQRFVQSVLSGWIGLDWVNFWSTKPDWTGSGSPANGLGLDWILSNESVSYSGHFAPPPPPHHGEGGWDRHPGAGYISDVGWDTWGGWKIVKNKIYQKNCLKSICRLTSVPLYFRCLRGNICIALYQSASSSCRTHACSHVDAEIKTMETSSRSSATKCEHLKIEVILPLSFFAEGNVLKSRFTYF